MRSCDEVKIENICDFKTSKIIVNTVILALSMSKVFTFFKDIIVILHILLSLFFPTTYSAF